MDDTIESTKTDIIKNDTNKIIIFLIFFLSSDIVTRKIPTKLNNSLTAVSLFISKGIIATIIPIIKRI